MTIEKKTDGRTLTLRPLGRIDSTTGDEFLAFAEAAFTADFDALCLDMEEVDYISSKGLRVLLTLYKQLNGRQIRITGANTSVKEVFRITGLEKEFCVQ